jgi:hypothetical protein
VRIIAAVLALQALLFQTQAQPPQAPQPPQPPPAGRGGPLGPLLGRRGTPPQPQQKQGVDYFAGAWQFEYVGRESPVTAGPRTGTLTFTRKGAPNVLEMQTIGQTDAGAAFKESGTFEWKETDQSVAIRERVGRVDLVHNGTWASPLSIRTESQPVKAGNQTIRVRRNYSIISAGSFSLAEEISIDAGPFQRLGNATFGKQP